ncbi:hypothetical protein HDU92_004059 [Lobulomyces angularis]|nr:hypothetical protein HDU92_004059 [Lobulomyces angularis]
MYNLKFFSLILVAAKLAIALPTEAPFVEIRKRDLLNKFNDCEKVEYCAGSLKESVSNKVKRQLEESKNTEWSNFAKEEYYKHENFEWEQVEYYEKFNSSNGDEDLYKEYERFLNVTETYHEVMNLTTSNGESNWNSTEYEEVLHESPFFDQSGAELLGSIWYCVKKDGECYSPSVEYKGSKKDNAVDRHFGKIICSHGAKTVVSCPINIFIEK